MKTNFKFSIFGLLVIFTFFSLRFVSAATTPSLGMATTYGVLSSTYTNIAVGTVNGDVGFTTPPAVFPTINGTTVTPKSPQAGIDQGVALATLNSQSCDFNFTTATDLSLLPQPLIPGVYCITAATSIGTAGITLNGNGTYIFRISGALTTVSNSVVSIAGGANACDIFWTPSSATTLGADSIFIGTVIDNAGITVGNNVTWLGRALSFATTVTTNNSTITVPICVSIPTVIDTGVVDTTVIDTGVSVSVSDTIIPKLPKTGAMNTPWYINPWYIAIIVGILLISSSVSVVALRKHNN